MGRKRYTPEQIIRLLCQSEVLSSEGRNLPEICREIGVTTNTYYRWRNKKVIYKKKLLFYNVRTYIYISLVVKLVANQSVFSIKIR